MAILGGQALGLATITVVGQCVGAGDYAQARRYNRKLMLISWLLIAASVAAILISLPLLLNLYNISDEARVLSAQLVRLHNIPAIALWCLSFTLPNTLRAAGDARFTMVVSIVSMAVFRIGFSVVLGIYFTWFIGTALEREWGDFRYTVYLLSGVLGTVLGCLLTGVTASTYCLSLSLLLAFAMLYPEVQLLLFFIIPIRVKYFGVFAAVLWVFSFLGASLPGKLDYLLSMLNVWLFFAPMAYRSLRAWVRREQWKRKNRR